MKQLPRLPKTMVPLLFLMITAGCGATKDPGFWSAWSQSGQQMNQQNLQQQQQWQVNHDRVNAENQSTVPASPGRSLYNPYTHTYTYVPPGWEARWDSQRSQWVVSPQ